MTRFKAFSSAERKTVRCILQDWFRKNQRPLPWRKSYDPYHVWISEIMGQQTRMDRVVEYFKRWLHRFPDISAVASAGEQQILKAWEGLGYYSRARNIHRTARILIERHDGSMPDSLDELLDLPGIGPYTAAAILSIAWNKPCPLLDANVERLFVRLLDIGEPVKTAVVKKHLYRVAADLLPEDSPRLFNQALMEFGALVCLPRAPACPDCPLVHLCRSRRQGTVTRRPVIASKTPKIDIVMACGIIVAGEKLYIQQRLADDVWGGLWEFPGGRLKDEEQPVQAACREVREETEFAVTGLQPYRTVLHYYTRYRVTLHSFFCTLAGDTTIPVLHAAQQYRWVTLSDLSDFPFPAGHRMLVERLRKLNRIEWKNYG